MAPAAPAKAPSQSDVRAARQLLALFPFMGQVWATAVREGGGGSLGRFKTLGILESRGAIRAGELALLCGSTPSAITDVIEGLVADGQVRRIDDPTDRRAVVVELTDKGHAERDRVGELMTAAMVRAFDGLSAEQKTRLRAAIADLNEILVSPTASKETRIVR
ncbi:MAG: MarR family transcriptional regulator [Chloroflexota bacterium]|nr:MarR family transcriptional regulator [Chloroflexota bacterium]